VFYYEGVEFTAQHALNPIQSCRGGKEVSSILWYISPPLPDCILFTYQFLLNGLGMPPNSCCFSGEEHEMQLSNFSNPNLSSRVSSLLFDQKVWGQELGSHDFVTEFVTILRTMDFDMPNNSSLQK